MFAALHSDADVDVGEAAWFCIQKLHQQWKAPNSNLPLLCASTPRQADSIYLATRPLYSPPSQVLIPDVPKSCFPWCTYFLFSLMYLSPVFPDVPNSCLRCCIIFLFSMMYLIPVWAVGPYFLLCCIFDVPKSCFSWCTYFLFSVMYLSPVFPDVPNSCIAVVQSSCFPWCT